MFLSEFYNEPAIAVDTHVQRIAKRLKIAKSSDNVLAVERKLNKFFPQNEWGKRHLQLVLLYTKLSISVYSIPFSKTIVLTSIILRPPSSICYF